MPFDRVPCSWSMMCGRDYRLKRQLCIKA
jgi:hypothetical protein